jgi:hypothetical protein
MNNEFAKNLSRATRHKELGDLCFFGDLKRKIISKYIITNLKTKNTNIWMYCVCSLSFVGMLLATCKKMGSNIDPLLLVTNKMVEHHCLCSLM